MDSSGWFLDRLPLVLRSNALVQCGNDASSDDFCVIDGTGTHGIIIDPHSFGFADSSTSNVTIQGVTVDYFAPNKYFSSPVTLGLTNGDVTFLDCIFSNNFGDSIFSIQQYVFSRRLFQSEQNTYPATAKVASEDFSNHKPKASLKFIFKSCKFKSNEGPTKPVRPGGVSLLSFSAFEINSLTILPGTFDVDLLNNQFIDNFYNSDNDASLYRGFVDFFSTGKLTMENNCFINSILSPLPYSSIVIALQEATLQLRNNYRDTTQRNLECPYVMHINTDQSKFRCWNYTLAFNATDCSVRIGAQEMTAMTPAPTAATSPIVSSIKLPSELFPMYPAISPPVISETASEKSPSFYMPLFATDISSFPEISSPVPQTGFASATPSFQYHDTKSNSIGQSISWTKYLILTWIFTVVCNA